MGPIALAIIVTIIVVGGTYILAIRLSKGTVSKMNLRILELAQKMGLPEPETKNPALSAFYVSELNGEVDGRIFSFTQFTRSSKRAGAFVTEFSWACKRNLTLRIIISKEGVFTPLSKQLGVTDIQIGDAVFDEMFLIRCDDADYARKLLNEDVRKEIVRRQQHWHGTLVIHHHEVHYEESGVIVDEKDLQRVIRLIDLAKSIAETLETLEN